MRKSSLYCSSESRACDATSACNRRILYLCRFSAYLPQTGGQPRNTITTTTESPHLVLAVASSSTYVARWNLTMKQFYGFSDSPTEVRHQIWLHCVPDNEAEVCRTWPSNVPSTAFVRIDTGSATQDSRRNGVLCRASQTAGCQTPFRSFRPELGVLFLSHDGIWCLGIFCARNARFLHPQSIGPRHRDSLEVF